MDLVFQGQIILFFGYVVMFVNIDVQTAENQHNANLPMINTT
jgi:hypothetical protein